MVRTGKSRVSAAPKWPVYSIRPWPIDDLVPYARNARQHSDGQVQQLAALIRQYGWTMPILVDAEGEIIAGHGRVLAAKSIGFDEVPVAVAEGWSEEQKRSYRIADNRLSELSTWDDDLLKAELGELSDLGADLTLTGFDVRALDRLLGAAARSVDPESVPDVDPEPVSLQGDVWVLGGHRLICGDSTDAATVSALLGGERPRLMVTDPPYGVAYDPSWREGADLGVGKRSKGKVLNDDRADWTEAWRLFQGAVAYVWHGGLHSATVQTSLEAVGFGMRAQIVWAKQHFVMSRGDYHWMHEPCWYAVRKGSPGGWAGDRKQTTVWNIANNNSFGNRSKEKTWGHGTQKPVECMKRPLENSSERGDAVYEPFCGSGTTVIAAEMTERRCFAIELNPLYVDVTVRRWQEFVGLDARLESTGQTFEEVARDRVADAAPVP